MVAEENYEFKPEAKKKIAIVGAVGIVLFILGVFMAMSSGSGHGEEHASAQVLDNLVASTEQAAAAEGDEAVAEEHHGSPVWLKRVYTSLWQNNVFFAGLGIIGLFFVAIQYAAQAGWSVPVKRIALAMGHWIPISGILMLVLWFIVKADVFHWTHHDLYVEGEGFDAIINGKSAYFFWPLEAGGFPLFYVLRLVVFFGLWYMFFIWIKKEMLAEDINGGTAHWTKARSLSAVFLVIFAVTSSVAAWDWVMSIDTHWFSTMMGWYVFASWWVTGLAFITVAAAYLKEAGYLKLLNANHLHDLGKFVFAFSIFWTYIWFSQFLLIYYANIPEETVYFVTRINNSPYGWIFYTNIILNFVLPFLLLMTRDAKRHMSMLKVVCPIVIVGHWFDFYNMVTPGVMQHDGGLGFIEIGLAMVFMAAFLFITLNALSKAPLVAKNHPMMGEALNHHI
ncbi:MAG: quinol:cytochrome C oxidoreductase [Cyclobacteriaceae bacterium]